MIEFSKHATHMGWNDVALYGKFYRELSEYIIDQLPVIGPLPNVQQLKANALKTDTTGNTMVRRLHPLVTLGNPPLLLHHQNQATP